MRTCVRSAGLRHEAARGFSEATLRRDAQAVCRGLARSSCQHSADVSCLRTSCGHVIHHGAETGLLNSSKHAGVLPLAVVSIYIRTRTHSHVTDEIAGFSKQLSRGPPSMAAIEDPFACQAQAPRGAQR